MASIVRRCTSCGNEEMRFQWHSMDEASKAGALELPWACPNCGWPEAELVEVDSSQHEQEELAHSNSNPLGR